MIASVPDWITAISTASLGVFGALFTGWQFWMDGFRPQCTAKIDGNFQGIMVQIANRGRADGVIQRVVVVERSGYAMQQNAPVEGYERGEFQATTLPARAAMRLIITHPAGLESFPLGIHVNVEWGTGSKSLTPLQVKDVGYVGMPSLLPPRRS